MTQLHATLLIVDDNPTNLALLFKALEREGYRVLVNTSGEAALHTAEKIMPDIILLDVMMPGIDGFETCQRLKNSPVTADIPVVFLTALTDTVDKVKGFQLGAVDYVTKPIEMAELLARVNTHITLRQLRVQLEQRNAELTASNHKLHEALGTIKTLSGLVPICAWCHNKIRDNNDWVDLVVYLRDNTEAEFTHGLCPDCMKTMEAEV